MARLQGVSRSQHADKRVKKAVNLFFAQHDNVLPFGISEFPKMAMSTAVGFMTIDGSVIPVALQGLVSGQNLFVGRDGRWLGSYIPAMYLCYPFRLAKAENSELILCIDEESGLITDASSGDGELFFDAENNPSAIIKGVMANLDKLEQDRINAKASCSVLQKYELFEPWPIQIQSDDGVKTMEGLNRVNERKLNTLPGEVLLELRNAHALQLAYGQLLSMHNLQQLGKLAVAHRQATQQGPVQDTGNIDFGVLEDSGSISFDNL